MAGMFIIVMGVSGSGKTTIGKKLAEKLGWPFFDADDFHPRENVAKMVAGIPLNDQDRAGWLAALSKLIQQETSAGNSGVLACSALKESYRQVLSCGQVRFVYLKGTYELILARMASRGGHFMKPAMLVSQFATLEEPSSALTVDISLPEDEIVQAILETISAQK